MLWPIDFTLSKALPFCHVTLKGQKPLAAGYPRQLRTLGDHLRKRRLDLGLSQRELAERLKVSKRSVETWERNRVKPSRTLALELRGFLGLEVPAHPTQLAGRLMSYRRSRSLSQGDMAKLLGVHTRTVIRWETGRTTPVSELRRRVDVLLAEIPVEPEREYTE